MAPQADTHYGALSMEETPRKSGRSATLKFLVGLALVAVCVTAAVFAFTSPVQQEVATESVDVFQQEVRRGKDCDCKDECKPGDAAGKLGTCEVVDKNCVGYDNEKPIEKDGKQIATCEVFSGRYNCWKYPCQNEGICHEEVNGYSCQCPYGFEGTNCEKPTDFCAKNVCSKHASCSQCLSTKGDCTDKKLPMRKVGRQAYWCKCDRHYEGDGYPKDQTKVFGGSVLADKFLKGSTRYKGWLKRTAGSEECSDIDDCKQKEYNADTKKIVEFNPCQNEKSGWGTCTDSKKGDGLWTCDCSKSLTDKDNKKYPSRWMRDEKVFLEKGKEMGIDGYDNCMLDVNECTAGMHTCLTDVGFTLASTEKPTAKIATCTNTDGSFTCKCVDGWSGDGHTKAKKDATGCTDVDDCAAHKTKTKADYCKNGGKCLEGPAGKGTKSCDCPKTWKGKVCEIDVNECKEMGKEAWCASLDTHGRCSNNNGGFTCACNDGYTGFPAATPKVICTDLDECAPPNKPCGDAGTCKDLLRGFQCTCKPGYRGKQCDQDWDECALGIDKCHEHAYCKNTHGSYECHCMPGYSGSGVAKGANSDGACERIQNCYEYSGDFIRKDKAGNNVMKCGVVNKKTGLFEAHGECFPEESTYSANAYRCQCKNGWMNHDCGRDADECALGTHSCGRNANCQNLEGPQAVKVDEKRTQMLGFKCACNLGYTGDPYSAMCSDIDDCAFIHPTCKKSGAMCLTDGDCKKSDFPGDTCDTTKKEARCLNGVCKDLGEHSWTCNCIEGWGDANCGKDIDECSDHARFQCSKHARCENTKGSYECKCETGYFGDGLTCEEIDDCASSPCAHGKCTDHGIVGYGCTCEKGWKDSRCDHDENECLAGKDNCHAQGKCVNSPGSFYCRCISGMVGDGYNCDDLDDCDPNPCSKNVLSGTYIKFGKKLSHNGCKDIGANSYQCNCKRGYEGATCDELVNECEVEALNDCDANALCTESEKPPRDGEDGYTCECKLDFWGNGKECSACTDCSRKAPFGGWERDRSLTNCNTKHQQDNRCINVNECETGAAKCHAGRATCEDTQGSYNCECNHEFYTKIQSKGMATRREGEPGHKCYAMKKCPLGYRMVADGNQFQDRMCQRMLPNGDYAIETTSDNVVQCLTLWGEAEKVFPERYNWGGKTRLAATKDRLNRPGYIAAADMCKNPICGVCDFDGKTVKSNIRMADVARWKIVRLEGDNYLILADRAGTSGRKGDRGYRCLGFDRSGEDQIPSPYPQLLSWRKHTGQGASGLCANRKDGKVTMTEKVCTKDGDCTGDGPFCKKEHFRDGSWTSNGQGAQENRLFKTKADGTEIPTYFCGLNSLQDLMTLGNKQTVWNIHALGCQRDTAEKPARWECVDQKYPGKYLIRSLADGEKMNSGEGDCPSCNAHCMYFPDGEMQTNPTRISPKGDGVTFGGIGYKGPAGEPRSKADHECGIMPRKGESQEEALVRNKQAVFKFIGLARDRFAIKNRE